jgi:hypothetical protein
MVAEGDVYQTSVFLELDERFIKQFNWTSRLTAALVTYVLAGRSYTTRSASATK